jgi:uncharacterized protein YceK
MMKLIITLIAATLLSGCASVNSFTVGDLLGTKQSAAPAAPVAIADSKDSGSQRGASTLKQVYWFLGGR